MPLSKPKDKLLIITSGGDSPGMNAVTRAVVRSSIYNNLDVFACQNGYRGLVNGEISQMQASDVANCIQRGGTILRTSRCPEFLDPKVRAKCIKFLKERGINFLVAVGGDGTFRGASLLENEGGPKTIGIPASIDNDIVGTEYTVGYDTARNTALDAIDKIRDTASSHNRYFLIETMGRNAGFLAADVAVAGGAEFLLVPEFPISIEQLVKKINAPRRMKLSLLIVVAEGDSPGHSVMMAEKLRTLTPFEYRVCVLGHTQRGGTPSTFDRLAGSIMGNLAVTSLLSGKSSCMTSLNTGQYELTPFPDHDMPSRRMTDRSMLNLCDILSI